MRATVLCVTAVLALTTTACGGGEPGEPEESPRDAGGSEAAVEDPGDTRPFDIYLEEELGLIDYARNRAVARCMADQGFPQLAELPDDGPRAADILDIDLEDFGPTSEEVARERGFGQEFPPEQASVVSNDASYDAAMADCQEEAWSALGEEVRQVRSAYVDLGNQLHSSFLARLQSDSRTREALGLLLDCLDERGYVADDRQAFMDDFDVSRLGVEFGSRVVVEEGDGRRGEPGTVEVLEPPRYEYRPTDEEVEFALAYVDCRRSTGYDGRLSEVIADVQETVVAEYETRLSELNPAIEEAARTAADLTG